MHSAAFFALLVACLVPAEPTGKDPTDSDPPLDTDPSEPAADSDRDDTDPNDPPSDPPADAEAVRAFLTHGGDLDALLQSVAWSSGWPVWDGAGTYLFLAPGDAAWSLAGDFNDWAPEPMQRADGYSWAEVAIESPWGAGYKLVSDAGTAREAWQADLWARSYLYDENGRMSMVAPASDRPHLERWPALEGRGLRARDVDVWVPAGEGPWPLLIMHDGRNLFDPGAIWGGWRLGEALTTASDSVLVVGLDNTPDRMSEYVHASDDIDGIGQIEPLGAAYADLVVLDVLPWAESTWAVDGRRGVMGSSLGGLISLFIVHQHPGEFQFVGSLSGTLGWGRFGEDNPTVGDLFEGAGPDGALVYVDSGGGPGADGQCRDPDRDGWSEDDPDSNDNYCETRQFADTLAGAGWVWEQDLVHWWDEDAPHNEAAWSQRVARPIELFLSLP